MSAREPPQWLVWRDRTVPTTLLLYDTQQEAERKATELVEAMPELGHVNIMRVVTRIMPVKRGPPAVERF